MVSMPERAMFSPPGGFGVDALDGGTGVMERETTPASAFESLDSVRYHEWTRTRAG